MSTPYKIGLAAAFLICALVVGYYALTDRASPPVEGPPPAERSEVPQAPATPDDRLAQGPADDPPPGPTGQPVPSDGEAAQDDLDAQRFADEAAGESSVRALTFDVPEAADEAPSAADVGQSTAVERTPEPAPPATAEAGDTPLDVAAPTDADAEADVDEDAQADVDADVGADADATPDTEADLATDTQREADTARTVPETYEIQPGDTLSGLATRFYGHDRHWRAIAEHNPGVDVDRLRVGQELRLPDPADLGIEPIPDDGTVLYTVRAHDTLGRIAQEHYGSRDAWRTIYEANRDRIGDNPDRIREGTQLRIPPAPEP